MREKKHRPPRTLVKSGRNVWLVTDGRGRLPGRSDRHVATRDCEYPGFPRDANVMRTAAADRLPDETVERFDPATRRFVLDQPKAEARWHDFVLAGAAQPENLLRFIFGRASEAEAEMVRAAFEAKDARERPAKTPAASQSGKARQ